VVVVDEVLVVVVVVVVVVTVVVVADVDEATFCFFCSRKRHTGATSSRSRPISDLPEPVGPPR
jgi:hypothetical protein